MPEMKDWSSELLIVLVKEVNSLLEEPLEGRGNQTMETMKGKDG
jgi:hypothetical protein